MTSSLTQLIEALQAGGPYALSAILIIGWFFERKDRKEKESHLRTVYEKIVTLVEESTRANDRMQAALTALKDAIQAIYGRVR